MSRLLHGAERSSFVQRDREGELRERIDRVKINSGDLCGINVQSDVADEVFGERRMFTSAPDRNSNIKPFTSLDLIRGDDFRSVLGIVRLTHLLELRCKLLRLSRPYGRPQAVVGDLTQSETERRHAPYKPLLMTSTHFHFPLVIDQCCAFYDPLQRRTS